MYAHEPSESEMASYGRALLHPLVQYHRVHYSMFPEYHRTDVRIYEVEQVVVIAHWNRGIHMHVRPRRGLLPHILRREFSSDAQKPLEVLPSD